jgi:hypothetical protein
MFSPDIFFFSSRRKEKKQRKKKTIEKKKKCKKGKELLMEEKQAHTQKTYARKIIRVFQNTRPRNQPHTRMDVMQALNNINVPIESNCKRKCMQSSDGHDPLDTWPIPQPTAISRASPAVASRSTFAQPAVASRSLSELSRGV